MRIETVAKVYPGRLVQKGTTAHDIVVATGVSPVLGWCGYDDQNPSEKADSVDTINTVNDTVQVLAGGNFALWASMPSGFEAVEGDYVIPWAAGQVAPAAYIDGKLSVRIPWGYGTTYDSAWDTTVDLVQYMQVGIPSLQVTAADAGETLDVGIVNATESGNEDGFLDGVDIATVGFKVPVSSIDGAITGVTLGEYFRQGSAIGAATSFYNTTSFWECDGTQKSIYVTPGSSLDTSTGYIWVPISSPGTKPVGIVLKAASVSLTASQDLLVRSLI
jgi:hypothetical protein